MSIMITIIILQFIQIDSCRQGCRPPRLAPQYPKKSRMLTIFHDVTSDSLHDPQAETMQSSSSPSISFSNTRISSTLT